MASDTALSAEPVVTPAGVEIFQDIPLVDFARFREGSPAEKLAIGRDVDDALQRVGFFYVVNHGVPQHLIDALFEQARLFFDRPEAEKLRVSIDRADNHRGYFSVGRENVDPTVTVDLKEGFDIGNEADLDGTDDGAMRGANQWPEQPTTLKPAMSAYYEAIHDFAKYLCRAMALAMGLPEDAFDKAVARPESRLRLLHYPSQEAPLPENRMGAGAHTDCGCLTILVQDEVGGLEVQNQQGDWVVARPIPGSFVVNVGDFMSYWSNNRFVSTRHRVINTTGRERYSIPLFLNPNFDIEVKGFDSLIGGETREKLSVSSYLRQCYDEIRAEPKS